VSYAISVSQHHHSPISSIPFVMLPVSIMGGDWRKGKYCTLMVHPVNLLTSLVVDLLVSRSNDHRAICTELTG